jgi:hypothetical protein
LVAHQTKEPRPVESFRSDIPAGMLAVLRKMMTKNPRDRYQEPIEVAAALAEWADQPVTAPPIREMPLHCPLVQALAGPINPAGGSNASLARVLFGPGRGVFSRTGAGSSASGSRAGVKQGSVSTSSYPVSAAGGSDPNYNGHGDAEVPVTGPVSTARASASPTAPISNRPESGVPLNQPGSGSSQSGSVVYIHPPRRTGLYVVIGVLFALLFAAGAVAAYYIGRSAGS